MWANFKSMPRFLKFLTALALFTFLFFVFSVFPIESFSINGRNVTYSEWWSSGVGPFASLLGVYGLFAGWLLLAKRPHARVCYLVFLILGLVVPYLFIGPLAYTLVGLIVVGVGAFYLYLWQGVQVYFATDDSSKRTRAKPRAA